jgi:peroxiredoxin Q/BCP
MVVAADLQPEQFDPVVLSIGSDVLDERFGYTLAPVFGCDHHAVQLAEHGPRLVRAAPPLCGPQRYTVFDDRDQTRIPLRCYVDKAIQVRQVVVGVQRTDEADSFFAAYRGHDQRRDLVQKIGIDFRDRPSGHRARIGGSLAAMAAIGVGDAAPDFTLPAQDGSSVTLSAFRREKVVVLYFYPKDETAGCTREACAFRDSHDAFAEAGAQVIGVSSDSVAAHDRFAKKHGLPFTLVADEDGAVRTAYGVQASLFGLIPGRVTYVIDREGVVRHVFSSQANIGKHIDGALRVVESLAAPAV